jgi:hypothetical protein
MQHVLKCSMQRLSLLDIAIRVPQLFTEDEWSCSTLPYEWYDVNTSPQLWYTTVSSGNVFCFVLSQDILSRVTRLEVYAIAVIAASYWQVRDARTGNLPAVAVRAVEQM